MKVQWTDVCAQTRMISKTLWRLLLHFFIVCTRVSLRSESSLLSPFATMTTPTHCSPSRSSLSCCQFEHNSQDDMRSPTIIGKDNYFLQREKHSFPKRPEVDLSFRDIRYRVKEWSLRNFSISKSKSKKNINNNNILSRVVFYSRL